MKLNLIEKHLEAKRIKQFKLLRSRVLFIKQNLIEYGSAIVHYHDPKLEIQPINFTKRLAKYGIIITDWHRTPTTIHITFKLKELL